MDLKEHYKKLYNDSIEKISTGSYHVDKLIDSPNDNRRGITLLLRPDLKVSTEIQKFLSHLKDIEPQQYYYPITDLHVTVMSIISCYEGFNLRHIRVEDYVNMINESLKGIGPFNIEFRGITASPSCLMVQGFIQNNALSLIRENLRHNFKRSKLQQSIDKRYAIQTAHSTIFRIKENLKNKDAFLQLLEEYSNHNFGTFSVDNLEFVFNDWYQRKKYVKTLQKFNLG